MWAPAALRSQVAVPAPAFSALSCGPAAGRCAAGAALLAATTAGCWALRLELEQVRPVENETVQVQWQKKMPHPGCLETEPVLNPYILRLVLMAHWDSLEQWRMSGMGVEEQRGAGWRRNES